MTTKIKVYADHIGVEDLKGDIVTPCVSQFFLNLRWTLYSLQKPTYSHPLQRPMSHKGLVLNHGKALES
jgi:hypothetical protein